MLNCIVTGLGGRGLHWVRNIRNHKGICLGAFVEPMAANRERAIAQHDIPADRIFDSLEAALGSGTYDFVMDVTPPAAHATIAEQTFAAGLHLLGEKPLSDDYAVAKRVVELGNKASKKHMITQNYRFSAQPRTTRQRLAEGIIGKPGQCDVRFYMPWADSPGSHYVTQPFMLINDMMVHHFDMIRYVLGVDPVAVQAITWNQPWGWHAGDAAHAIVFEFEDGMRATHVSVGCAVGSQTHWNGDWRIEGPEGSIDWIDGRMWHARLHRTPKRVREEIFPLSVPPAEQAILDEFLSAINEDREPECSAADNLHSVAMVFAAIQSSKEGRRVKLSELG
jgi:predicted dehydrogenase